MTTPVIFPKHYGKTLRMALENAGMSQRDLAEKIGVSPNRIQQYLKSKKFHATTVARMCDAIGITPETFRRIQ